MISSSTVYNINITVVSSYVIQTNPSTVITPGTYAASFISTTINMFSIGTYIVSSAGGGAYNISAPILNISYWYFKPVDIVFYYTSLSLPAPSALGTTTFYVDSGSTMNLQLQNNTNTTTSMITMKPSGISLNNQNIYLTVPPTLNYLSLPALNPYQIGYNTLINGNNPASATTVASGSFTSLINGGFTLQPGVYTIIFQTYITQQYGTTAGFVNYNTVSLSTISTGLSGGCNCYCSGMMYFPASCPWPYILNTSTSILNVYTPTTYYFLLNVNYASITLQINGSLNSISYVRIA